MSTKYTPTTIPTKYKTTIYTHYCISGWSAGEIRSYDMEMTGEDYVLLATTEVSVKIPPQGNIKQKVVEALKEEQKKQMANHEKKMNEIQAKIDSLLCLEYQPSEAIFGHDDETINEVPF